MIKPQKAGSCIALRRKQNLPPSWCYRLQQAQPETSNHDEALVFEGRESRHPRTACEGAVNLERNPGDIPLEIESQTACNHGVVSARISMPITNQNLIIGSH